MSNKDSIHLSLLENSHAFLKEAVRKALAATTDIQHWQFAILNLVQSLELSLKAALKAIHPILVYEEVDNPKNTVTLQGALRRLEKIGGLTFSERDKKKIQHAMKMRNDVTHSDFSLTGEYAAAKFFEVFAFVSDFQRRHLDTRVSDIIPGSEFDQLVKIRQLLDELVLRAKARITKEKIDEKLVWACPNCGQDAFVIEEGADVCYACSHSDAVVECPYCEQLNFKEDMISFADYLDTDDDEGQWVVLNSYGYRDYSACPECLPKIKEDIQNQRAEEEFRRLEEEYYLRSS
jgi:rubrerythrin